MRRIGVLMGVAESDPEGKARVAAFRQALADLGWTDGRNLRVDYRWAVGDLDRVRAHAADLTALAPDVLVGNGTAVLAALRDATRSIPIVFVIVNDPVGQGFIPNLARPGGNITGFSFLEYSMVGKSLELLKKLAPGVDRVAVMFNPDTTPHYIPFLRSFAGVSYLFALRRQGRQFSSRGVHDQLGSSRDWQAGLGPRGIVGARLSRLGRLIIERINQRRVRNHGPAGIGSF